LANIKLSKKEILKILNHELKIGPIKKRRQTLDICRKIIKKVHFVMPTFEMAPKKPPRPTKE